MQKLEKLSSNIPIILMKLLNNQNLCKYIYYNQSNPLSQPNLSLPATNLLFNKIFPYPFNLNIITEVGTQIHVYYMRGKFNNNVVENHSLFFDIICSKINDIWLISGGDIRPYKIMEEIINCLFNKNIDGLGGKVIFHDFNHLFVNESFDGVRIISHIVNISTGKK